MKKVALLTILLLVLGNSLSLAQDLPPRWVPDSWCFDAYGIDPVENILVAAYGGHGQFAIANRDNYKLFVLDVFHFQLTEVDGLGQMPIHLAYDGDDIAVTLYDPQEDQQDVYRYTNWSPEDVSRVPVGKITCSADIYFDRGNIAFARG